MRRRVLSFRQKVAECRAISVAYDEGYRAFERGMAMESPLLESFFRSKWYEGYIDAKYPEDKYETERRSAKSRKTNRR